MTRYGCAIVPAASHVNSMLEVAFELRRRGNDIVFISILDFSEKIKALGFDVIIIGAQRFEQGFVETFHSELGSSQGLASINKVIDMIQTTNEVYFCEAPDLLRRAAIDLLVIDHVVISMITIADFVRIPYVLAYIALGAPYDPLVPPVFSQRIPSDSYLSRFLTYLEHLLQNFMTRRIAAQIHAQRRAWKLPPLSNAIDAPSARAHVIQFPRSVEFAREHLPDNVHYVGRLADPSGDEPLFGQVDFPFDRLDGRPLIYASLGTIQTRVLAMYDTVIAACAPLAAQLVVSLGDREADMSRFAGAAGADAVVVPFAPQERLVRMASVVVTHGGNNTATMAMSHGVPMVVMPIASDQPGVAARVAAAGLGQRVYGSGVSVEGVRACVRQVLEDGWYGEKCRSVQREISEAGGVRTAADVIESALARCDGAGVNECG